MRVDTIQAGDFLRLSAQRFPDRDCFVFDDGSSRSFAQVNTRVNQLAGALHGRGVSKGDRVALLGTDSGEYVEVMMACMKLGAVYVPLNNRLADAEVLTLLRRAEPKAVFASSRYASRVALAFTSGTTGLPKGVLQSQRMINALALQMSVDYQIQLDEFRYTASPVFHIAGQAMIFMHVQLGFPTLILPQFEEGAVLRWMQSAGAPGELRQRPFGHLRGVADVTGPAAAGYGRVQVRFHQRVRGGDGGRAAVVTAGTSRPARWARSSPGAARSCPATWRCLRRVRGRCGTGGSGAGIWRGWMPTGTCTWRGAART